MGIGTGSGRGGARPGAGRPRKGESKRTAPSVPIPPDGDALAFLIGVMRDPGAGINDRIKAASVLLPFQHPRKGESGKKEVAAEKAAEMAAGRFGARPPPKLSRVQ